MTPDEAAEQAVITEHVEQDDAAKLARIEEGTPFDREQLGRMVREVWVAAAREHPDPKPSWLVPWDELGEWDKEVGRRIGEAVASHAALVTAIETHQVGSRERAGLIRQRDLAMTEAAKLRAELEHARSALAGDNEGVRLWMLDCAALTAKHRARADEAEGKLADIATRCRGLLEHAVAARVPRSQVHLSAVQLLAIIDGEAAPRA